MNFNLKYVLVVLSKILVILLLLFCAYYFYSVRPRIRERNLINQAKVILSVHRDILVKNKLSFIQLAKLNSDIINFEQEKSDLIANLKDSNKKGLEELNKYSQIPNININLNENYLQIRSETRKFYEDQNNLLDKVFATKSFNEGVEIMKSDESVGLLVAESNLILEYQFWITKLESI